MSGRYPNIRKRVIDGITFASKAEALRYVVLKDMEARKEILGLKCHPHFDFVVNGVRVGHGYTADFCYVRKFGTEPWPGIVEDVKGPVERDWPLRRDLFLALYPNATMLVNGKEVKRRIAT